MITITISRPRPTRPAVSRKSLLPPETVAVGLTETDGLATATGDRVGDGAALVATGAVVVGAAGVAVAVRVAVALAVGDAVAAAVGLGLAAPVDAGEGLVVLVPRDAHARESATPGADAQTDRAGVTQELPSAAVRASATKMNG
jgi:hypothetical protein